MRAIIYDKDLNPIGTFPNTGANYGRVMPVLVIDPAGNPITYLVAGAAYALPTAPVDVTGYRQRFNSDGDTVVVSEYSYMASRGRVFVGSNYDDDVDIAVPKFWHFIAGAATVGVKIRIAATGAGKIDVFEGATCPGTGVEIGCSNLDRNSVNTSPLRLFRDPIIAEDGTALGELGGSAILGAAGETTVVGDVDIEELRLQADTSYLVRFTANADDTDVGIVLTVIDRS